MTSLDSVQHPTDLIKVAVVLAGHAAFCAGERRPDLMDGILRRVNHSREISREWRPLSAPLLLALGLPGSRLVGQQPLVLPGWPGLDAPGH